MNSLSSYSQFFQFLGQNLAMPMIDSVGLKLTYWISGLVYFLSLYIMSHETNIYSFGIAYVLGYSIIAGVIYMASIGIVVEYYKETKGLMAGIVVFFYAVSGLLLQSILVWIINPQNKKPIID